MKLQLSEGQIANREYNQAQTQVGHALKTLKGSTVKRCKLGVGKLIGGQIYLHKDYYNLLPDIGPELFEEFEEEVPFNFNCLRYDVKKQELAFVESPDFDTADEPVVGKMFVVDKDGNTRTTRFFNQIWHHKWLWVDNSYTGFDVADSWEWSKEWLSVLTEPADGSNEANWEKQLARFNLI